MPETFRRIMTVLLALTFVVGLVPHGVRAADAGVKMSMTASAGMPMSGECCGDNQKAMTSAACSAYCVGFVGVPFVGTTFELASAEAFGKVAGAPPAGHTVPPDPYPPRPTILS